MRGLADAQLILEATTGKQASSTGWLRTNCPVCELVKGTPDRKSSFGLHIVTGFWSCFRCGKKGKVRQADLEGRFFVTPEMRAGVTDGKTPKTIKDPPPDFSLLAVEPARSAEELRPARRYLRKRGIPLSLWETANIGACCDGPARCRVVVPIFKPTGEWHGWVGRTWLKHERGCDCFHCHRKYLNAKGMGAADFLYNHAALEQDTEDPLLIVEGVFDALACWPYAAATLGSVKHTQLTAMLESPRPICFCPDGDAHEEGWWYALRLRNEGKIAGSIQLPPKTDPDEVDLEDLMAAARESMTAPAPIEF